MSHKYIKKAYSLKSVKGSRVREFCQTNTLEYCCN